MSTITVPEGLRRRVKRLASILDVPQHKVLEMLLDLFEKDLLEEKEIKVDPEIRAKLEKAREEVESKYPEWAKRSRKLEEALRIGIRPELFRGRWGLELEEDNA